MSANNKFPSKADVIARTPDPAVRELLIHMEKAGIETPFDRFDAQKPHCDFGLKGTCCKNCHMGPCRITPKSPKGVCGADAHLIVARNILRWTAAGAAAHGARGREVMLALKGAADECAIRLTGQGGTERRGESQSAGSPGDGRVAAGDGKTSP